MSAVIERNVEQERAKWMAILRDKAAPDGDILRAKVGMIETAREQIERAAPPGVDGKVIVDYAIQLLREDSKILPCTISSLVTSISRGAMCGLRLGGLRPEAYIVPTKVNKKVGPKEYEYVRTDANLWPSYHGWIKLVSNTGKLLADPIVTCVYEGEEFTADVEDGILCCRHKGSALNPARRAGDDRKITFVWARWKLESGFVDVVMSREEIEAHAKQYSKKPNYGEWNWETKWREMAEKTVLIHSVRRRHVPMQVEALGMGLLDEEPADASPRLGIADSLGVIDGEFSAVDDDQSEGPANEAQATAPQSRTSQEKQSPPPGEPSKPVAAETLDQVFGRFIERLAQTKSVAEAGKVYDAFFAPDSAHKWTPEHEAAGAKARTEHNELVRPK